MSIYPLRYHDAVMYQPPREKMYLVWHMGTPKFAFWLRRRWYAADANLKRTEMVIVDVPYWAEIPTQEQLVIHDDSRTHVDGEETESHE